MTMDLIFPVRNIGFSKKKPSKFVTANKHNELCVVDFTEFFSMFFSLFFPFSAFFFCTLENPNNNKTTKGLSYFSVSVLSFIFYVFFFFCCCFEKISVGSNSEEARKKKHTHFLLDQNN